MLYIWKATVRKNIPIRMFIISPYFKHTCNCKQHVTKSIYTLPAQRLILITAQKSWLLKCHCALHPIKAFSAANGIHDTITNYRIISKSVLSCPWHTWEKNSVTNERVLACEEHFQMQTRQISFMCKDTKSFVELCECRVTSFRFIS